MILTFREGICFGYVKCMKHVNTLRGKIKSFLILQEVVNITTAGSYMVSFHATFVSTSVLSPACHFLRTHFWYDTALEVTQCSAFAMRTIINEAASLFAL